ncbi:hypothetical protein AX14_005099, partial [Amanita brunnescens Koide BX004]
MDDVIKDCLHEAIKAAVPPSSTDSIAILNKPPTTALKFSSVPRHNEDGTDADSYDLLNDLMSNDIWRDVEIFSQPRFLPMKPEAAGGTVIVSVVDDNVGSVGRKLMNTVVNFSGTSRRCLRWVEKEAQLHCIQCQGWGHLNFNCLSNIMRCSKCAGPHDYRQHDRYCEICKSGKGHLCLPKCFNCRGAHFANSKECVFYINRSSKERQVQLRDEFNQKWKEEDAALKAAANSDSGRAARVATAIKDSRGKGKGKAHPSKPNDNDDFVPVGKGGKAKYTFSGMTQALAPTTRIDTVVEHKDDGDNNSDASSELRLSYVDDIPLKQRFPALKPPAAKTPIADPPKRETTTSAYKPLTITLPATGHKPSRSITDILRELKNPAPAAADSTASKIDTPLDQDAKAPTSIRFDGGSVTYSSSALASEAAAIDFLFVQEAPYHFIRKIPSTSSELGDDFVGPVIHCKWQCVDKRSTHADSQVAIYVNTRFTTQYQLFPVLDPSIDTNVLALCVRHNLVHSNFFHLVNVYNQPGSRHAAIESLLRIAPSLPNLAVVQGDFNLHSPLWDPAISSHSGLGERLFNTFSDLQLNLANDDGDATWTNRHGASSVIDLLFYHDLLARISPQTLVDLESRGRSDHAILFLAFDKQAPHWGRPYIARDSEEEAAYLHDLAGLDPESAGNMIMNAASLAWSSHSKLPRVDSNPNSWWTNDCQLAKDKYLLHRSRANLAVYNATTKAARQAHFMHKIELMTENNAPWEGIRWTKPRAPPRYSVIKDNGAPVSSMPALFDLMHNHFLSSSSHASPSDSFLDTLPQTPVCDWPKISVQEVSDMLKLTSNSSALGPDFVTWHHLKQIFDMEGVSDAITLFFNNICDSGIWPSWFKQSVSVIIPKPKKTDYTVPKAYRPIALLNTMGKLLTKVLANRMQFDAAAYSLLHEGQCGGIRKHATIDAGIVLLDFINTNRERGWHTSVCAIDVAQFFPSLNHGAVTRVLSKLGFADKLTNLMASYFVDRQTIYRWDSASSAPYPFSFGTPQGDCLSPIVSALFLSVAIKHVF